MTEVRPARWGTFANELTQDGDTSEYGLVIWLGTKDEAEAAKLADDLAEAWNENTAPEADEVINRWRTDSDQESKKENGK